VEGGSTVKLVMAILQPSRLEAVKEALIEARACRV
jgi:nitrogen regulatory protein PII